MKIKNLQLLNLLKTKSFRFCLTVVTLLVCFNTALSQSAGFLGKKLVVKTNLINGRRLGFNALDVEYAVGRNVTLVASFQHFNYTQGERGIRAKTGVIKPGNDRNDVKEITTLKNGNTTGWIASFGCRYYFDKIIPALYGYYMGVNFGYGSASYSDYKATYEFKDIGIGGSYGNKESHQRPDSKTLSGVSKILFFELPNFGYQRIFKGLITLDANFAIQGQYCALPEEMLNAMEHNYFARSNTVSFGYNKLNLGLAVYLKLGVLIF